MDNIYSVQDQEETQDELITRLDGQYRALIDKYEDLLEMFNQTRRENQDHMAGHQQMSLQEELSSSDYKVELINMDMLNISHDVSLNITYDSWTEQNYKIQSTINHTDLINGSDNKEIEHGNSEKMNEKTESENADVEKEVIENTLQTKLSKNAKDDYRNVGCDNNAQSVMNR